MLVNSAYDFLTALQKSRVSPIPYGESNQAFRRIFLERLKTLPQEQATEIESMGNEAHEKIFDRIWDDMKNHLPMESKEYAQNFIAVGLLDHMKVNAACHRSPQGFYAITINRGLPVFFNKISKVLAAAAFPSSITYCSREISSNPDIYEIMTWYEEMTKAYKTTGIPAGPQIHLDGKANRFHAYQLSFWEYFILAHEVAHFLCGHLENRFAWRKDTELHAVDTYDPDMETDAFEKEHQADIVGFLLARRLWLTQIQNDQIKRRKWDRKKFKEISVLHPLVSLFNLLSHIEPDSRKSHPPSLKRAVKLVRAVYGDKIGSILDKSYNNTSLLGILYKSNIRLQRDLESAIGRIKQEKQL